MTNTQPVVPRKFLAIFVMLVSCFALWGVLNNMTDNLVPAFGRIFMKDPKESALVQVAFYGAYAVLAIFASILIEEFSYKLGVLIGLGVYILGALLYIPACMMQSFDTYFIAIFIVASGCSVLETTCNPYILSLGDPSTAVRRLNFAQMFNPVGSLAGIFLAKVLILRNLHNELDIPARKALSQTDPGRLAEVVHSELFWVCVPYVGLCIIAAVIWFGFVFNRSERRAAEESGVQVAAPTARSYARVGVSLVYAVLPLVVALLLFPEMNKILWVLCGVAGTIAYVLTVPSYRESLVYLLKAPRYWGGVVAQFFYIGVQIAAWTWLNAYVRMALHRTEAEAASYYVLAIVLFLIARWIATWLMKFFDPARMMALFAAGAIASCAGVMYLGSNVLFTVGGMAFSPNVLCLCAMSGFMSLMFPTIYGIALGKLDQKALKLGAAGLIMAILGGAILTPWMGAIAGNVESSWIKLIPSSFSNDFIPDLLASEASLRASFVVPVICFAVVLAYAWIFRAKREKAA